MCLYAYLCVSVCVCVVVCVYALCVIVCAHSQVRQVSIGAAFEYIVPLLLYTYILYRTSPHPTPHRLRVSTVFRVQLYVYCVPSPLLLPGPVLRVRCASGGGNVPAAAAAAICARGVPEIVQVAALLHEECARGHPQ